MKTHISVDTRANPANSAKHRALPGFAAVRSLANRAHRPGPVSPLASIPAFAPIATPPGVEGGIRSGEPRE